MVPCYEVRRINHNLKVLSEDASRRLLFFENLCMLACSQKWRKAMVEGPLLTPEMIRGRDINIIGLGSLGGSVFQNLFRTFGGPIFEEIVHHIGALRLWDVDTVEARNRFNQRVFAEDLGKTKIAAQYRIAQAIYPESKLHLATHLERVGKGTKLSGIVLAAVDSMRERRVIWSCVKNNPAVSFLADGRVGMDGGRAYGLDPGNPEHIHRYESPVHMYNDPPEVEAACKTEFPMPFNASIVASKVLWRLTRWLHLEQGCVDPYANFVGFSFMPSEDQEVEYWDEPCGDEAEEAVD